MTTPHQDIPALRAGLADQLAAELPSRTWPEVFRVVDRHVFAPRFALFDPVTGSFTHYDVHDPDPVRRAEAMAAAYSNDTLITRFDDDGNPISSSTEPSMMASMLAALDLRPGHRVLEVGTGTGYNAALLARFVGDEQVTTIDVDGELINTARAALDVTGYAPTVVCGDGAAGVPERAPFDRIMATCGVDRVPGAWLDQLTADGAILVTVSTGIALLRRGPDGAVTAGSWGQRGSCRCVPRATSRGGAAVAFSRRPGAARTTRVPSRSRRGSNCRRRRSSPP
ncbi:methyltransferase [Actinoalloteichus sp. AHMU CJ021]|uniref:methyltransferase domain-containing protein n=1 Tax=Actinoalloteichus sp. AHMU CJ021 TaxID=2072503 RepID=UPI000CA041CF|nr:methyltransferase [Actinoalloteichus sp. AHMU CJ021]